MRLESSHARHAPGTAVKPARKAAPPREINVNEVVGIDLVWIPTFDKKTVPVLNCIDWNTHFQMVIPMENKSPEPCREACRHWLKFFGPPQSIALRILAESLKEASQ